MCSEWVMVFITAIYTIATIGILVANKKSIEAAQAELETQIKAANEERSYICFHDMLGNKYRQKIWFEYRVIEGKLIEIGFHNSEPPELLNEYTKD